ncbi:glycosyltransferase [Solirubrobacter ginsenosidimutans]|uniref:Glycosyltransferase n=1 Tax=Solirubrobacter ginsenosidimutans TaxID=490573 RepID=A0A9X3MN13_9ACTN|nr:glycosyltransferase [Solirubrobacter ginsenosidimutans]MDA0159591.1 glycosyltransferase [Solirubrobacter ginsenosidimutans]
MARIALVCEPPDGGAAEHVAQLARGLGAHGHEAVVFGPEAFAPALEGVVRLPFRRDYAHPREDARAFATLLRKLRAFELVHAHSAKAGVLGRLAGWSVRRPVVYTPHGFPFVGEMREARRVFSHVVERLLAPPTAAIIGVCAFERDLARANQLHPRMLAVVHNGSPPCGEVAAHARSSRLVVGTVSALRRGKGVDVLLDAVPAILAAVPEAEIVIAGDGPQGDELRAHPSAGRVRWEPYRPPAANHLRELDVYVLASSWEAFPIGPLEALACGVPQVVTAVGGTREAVVPETGLLIPPRDPQALAHAAVELLRDPQRREAMRSASRERHAAQFTVDRMVAGTAAVYDAVLSNTRRGRR